MGKLVGIGKTGDQRFQVLLDALAGVTAGFQQRPGFLAVQVFFQKAGAVNVEQIVTPAGAKGQDTQPL